MQVGEIIGIVQDGMLDLGGITGVEIFGMSPTAGIHLVTLGMILSGILDSTEDGVQVGAGILGDSTEAGTHGAGIDGDGVVIATFGVHQFGEMESTVDQLRFIEVRTTVDK